MAHPNSSVPSTVSCPSCGRTHCIAPAQLLDDPRLAAELCPQARDRALSALTTLAAMIAALRPEPVAVPRTGFDDFTLSADDVATRLSKTRRWVFRHAKQLPFVRRISLKTMVASESGLNRWIAAQRNT